MWARCRPGTVLSAIGFYSVDPVSTKYIFGTPLFDKVTMHLSGGKKLVITARRQTPASIYVDSVELSGKPHPKSWFLHEDVAEGGEFVIHLKSQPNQKFGSASEDRPVSVLEIPKKS